MPRMPAFKHVCKPCEWCGGGNSMCTECGGAFLPCDCEAAYGAAADRKYEQWRDRLDEREERIRDDD